MTDLIFNGVVLSEPMLMPNNESVSHWVRWDGDIPTFTCNGNEHAPCHRFPDCECETWSAEHAAFGGEHAIVSHERVCWVLTWLQYVDVEATYGLGDNTLASVPRHNARIEWEWDSDAEGVLWTYRDAELNAPGAGE